MRQSRNKLQVSARAVEQTVAAVAVAFGVGRKHILNTRCQDPRAVAARHEAWRLLIPSPDVSVASLARLWPCDHTTVLDALNGGRRRRRAAETTGMSAPCIWDDERDALILKLRDESGLSGSQIARRVPFEASRLAVLARLWRLDGGEAAARDAEDQPRRDTVRKARIGYRGKTGRWDDDLFEPWAVRKARLAAERSTSA